MRNQSNQRSGTIALSLLLIAGTTLGLWLVSDLIARLVAEGFWFNEVGYPEAFWLRLFTKALIASVVAGFSLFFLFSNLLLANRLKHPAIPPPEPKNSKFKTQNSKLKPPPALSLRWVLLSAIALSLLIALLLLHYTQIVANLSQFAASQPGTTPIIPDRFRLNALFPLTRHLTEKIGPLPYAGIAMLGAGVVALMGYPKILLSAIALVLSLEWGFVLAANWNQLLLFLQAIPFKRVDPIFAKDIGFYIFSLPTWQLLEFWLMGLSLFTFLAVSLLYLLSANSLSEGSFPGFSHSQTRHLSGLAGCLMLIIAFSYWANRYELLYSPRGVVFGAGYTDVHVELPTYTAMAILACAIALFLFWLAARHKKSSQCSVLSSQFLSAQPEVQLKTQNSKLKTRETARPNPKSKIPNPKFQIPLPFLLLSSYLVLAIVLTTGLPLTVQRVVVQPNELTREQPYIRNSIAATRAAFNLENIQQELFNPVDNLTNAKLQENDPTIRNIRLWDTRPLLQTNRQLQQIRLYYRFPDADIDRYTLQSASLAIPGQPTQPVPNQEQTINQQVLISARELDFTAVPREAQTWVNKHLVYTHGYGFTLSPVNKVAPGGLPDYFVKDIGPDPNNPAQNLTVSNEAIRASIPIGHPRLYYGEITDNYVLTGTQVQELDYPSGDENIFNTYDGSGGIEVAPLWKRWLFARYLQDWEMVLTKYFTPQTKLLFRRNINQRVRAIAPFLRYDRDPYLVVANTSTPDKTQNSKLKTQNYLYWIIDAYTLSDHYPYSEPTQLATNSKKDGADAPGTERRDRFNYIRNSVKVVIDAYNGSVDFYVADSSDPIIQAWGRIFPRLFKPLSEMPAALKSHIRYPNDLFSAQSERLMRYHMTDPQVFYNQEDQWQIPNEIYGNQPRPVEPYFLITNLPTVVEGEEFILLLPYTPRQRTNLTAWLAARSDGANYGKLLLYVFPKQQLVFGTEQIEARINQDPVISQKISLWNRQGSRAIQGNLLVIPIAQSLLYVEPLYLEAEQNSLPTLVSVIVAYENRIAMTESLEQSLQAIFQPVQPAIPPIVRPVE